MSRQTAEGVYQDSIDFLDTWTGLTYPAQSGTSAVTSAASTAAVGTGDHLV